MGVINTSQTNRKVLRTFSEGWILSLRSRKFRRNEILTGIVHSLLFWIRKTYCRMLVARFFL